MFVSRRLSYTRLLVIAVLGGTAGWIVLARSSAQDDVPPVAEEPIAPPAAAPAIERVNLPNAIRDEIVREETRHEQRLKRLTAARQALVEAGAPAEAVREIDAAIIEEKAEHAARIATLQRWLRAERDPRVAPVEEELRDYGRALRRLNQSYTIAPITGKSAATAGSSFRDRRATEDAREPYEEPGLGDAARADDIRKLWAELERLQRRVKALEAESDSPEAN